MSMESVERKHPPELLSALPEICLNYFADKNFIVSHPAFDKTLKAVKDAIDLGLDQNMVNLVGLSGIGKNEHQRIAAMSALTLQAAEESTYGEILR